MKRLLTAAVFAFLACTGLATPSMAGSFGLFFCGRHCNEGAVCFRPYNAFSPVLYGDIPGYGSNGGAGGCGAGGCGNGGYGNFGGYGPIAYCQGCGQGGCGQGGCGQGGCGQGGCGQGGCGQGGYGYGWGNYGGWDPRHHLVNLRGTNDNGYTGALNHSPADGMGNGAFGNIGTGRLGVVGLPVGGGCASCNKGNYWTLNTPNAAPMNCGPQGCAPAAYGNPFGYPAMPDAAAYQAAPNTFGLPNEAYMPLLPLPTAPKAIEPTSANSPATMPLYYPAQPVAYTPGYNMPAQPMMPYGYMQPAWGYNGYQTPTYPAWGYRGW